MRTRPATAADVPAVVALERLVFGDDAWSPASVVEELTGPRRSAVVAHEAPQGLAGYAVILVGDDAVDLQRIAVTPALRRRGLARALLAAALDGQDPTTRVLLEVSADNAPALAFYTGQGFAQIHRRPRYYRDGSDALVLQALPGALTPPERSSS